jgi:hypothetical protein
VNDKQLRRRCEARLGELHLPDPFDVRSFCEELGRQRGRPILLLPVTGAADVGGVWISVPSADLIFYEQDTSPLHQEHIILHEVSHLLCAHQPPPVSDPEMAQLLFPHFDPETVRSVLQRSGYSTVEEREAELLASLILERAAGRRSGAEKALDREMAAVLEKHRMALEEQVGSEP